jgi:hypothetical protein
MNEKVPQKTAEEVRATAKLPERDTKGSKVGSLQTNRLVFFATRRSSLQLNSLSVHHEALFKRNVWYVEKESLCCVPLLERYGPAGRRSSTAIAQIEQIHPSPMLRTKYKTSSSSNRSSRVPSFPLLACFSNAATASLACRGSNPSYEAIT